MKNNQKIPVSILADREVFEYLKEKGDERKTRTEAYCDLLDKSLAGFVSPFLRKKDYVLQPNQCYLTVSDLASEWHWHRATVRSFLSAMEAFGLLTRIQLPKSVVITMTVQSGQAAQPRDAQEQPDFAGQLREVLSDWVIGKTTAAETGVMCGQLVSLAKAEIADRDAGHCSDTHSTTTSAHSGTLVTEHRETALCCIAHAALQKILHKSRFDDSSPLVDFFRLDLGEEWAAFIESAKDLAGLILDTEASVTDFDMDEDQERLTKLKFCKAFPNLSSLTSHRISSSSCRTYSTRKYIPIATIGAPFSIRNTVNGEQVPVPPPEPHSNSSAIEPVLSALPQPTSSAPIFETT